MLKTNDWATLEKIRSSTGLTHEEMAERLRLSARQYLRYRIKNKEISITHLEGLLDHFGISMTNFALNRINYRVLEEHAKGNVTYLPERYKEGAFSRARSVGTVINFVEETSGWDLASELLKRHQIHPAALKRPEEFVNLRMLTDTLDFLQTRSYSPETLFRIGQYVTKQPAYDPIKEMLQSCRGPKEIMEKTITQLIHLFDLNFDYGFQSLEAERCILTSKPSDRLKDALSSHTVGTRSSCHFKAGTASALMRFLGLPAARVKETACVYHGAKNCHFEINYTEAFLAYHYH